MIVGKNLNLERWVRGDCEIEGTLRKDSEEACD
jgi:hypothetical protein